MKFALLFLLTSAAALGQSDAQRLAQACGPASTSFKVDLDRTQHGPLPAPAGKAMVYFIHDAGIPFKSVTMGYPTTKYAVDGAWVGAGHGDSWFAVPLDAGEHHICTTLQSSFFDQRVELAHFTADPGKSYYVRTRLLMSGSVEVLEMNLADSDQGSYLVSVFPMAKSTQKK